MSGVQRGPQGGNPDARPPAGGGGISSPRDAEIRRRMTTTPAQALPRLEQPATPEAPEQGWIGEILERLDVIEDTLGIRRRRSAPYSPLPGSDVQPLDDKEP